MMNGVRGSWHEGKIITMPMMLVGLVLTPSSTRITERLARS